MADLTADRVTPDVVNVDNVQGGYVLSYGIQADQRIFKGSFVEIDSGGDIEPAGTASLSQQIIGVALENKLGGSADSDVSCKVLVGSIIEHALTSTRSDIGAFVYASDDQTLTLTRANGSALVGRMVAIGNSANTAYIKMDMPRDTNTTGWALTNLTDDYDQDLNAPPADAVLADLLGTLIRDLARQGIVAGSVT